MAQDNFQIKSYARIRLPIKTKFIQQKKKRNQSRTKTKPNRTTNKILNENIDYFVRDDREVFSHHRTKRKNNQNEKRHDVIYINCLALVRLFI